MLNLEVKSNMDAEKLVDKVIARFAGEEGMGITELVSHLHAGDQALDVSLSNAGNPSEARARVESIAGFAASQYGYEPVRYLLHFDDTGNLGRHLVVDIAREKPVKVGFQSNQADEIVRAFAKTIS